jgi:hypothetical protein
MPRPVRARPGVEPLEPREVPAAPFETLPVLPTDDPAALDHARAIAVRGRELGRRADAFMKVGDSNTATGGYVAPQYLNPLGAPGYDPYRSGLAAAAPDLLDTLAAFRTPLGPSGENSFTRTSSSAYPGWTLPNVLPTLAGEVAATGAAVALVMIGTNDLVVYGDGDPGPYREMLRQLVRTLTAAGVVPVLSTLPDHADNPAYVARTRVFNQAIADLAEEERVPLWNFWRQTRELPNGGLDAGGVHLTASPNGGGAFGPGDLRFGQNARNLAALEVLDWFRERVAGAAEDVAPLPGWTPLPTGLPVFGVGRDIGQEPAVSVFGMNGALLDRLTAFDPSFDGGVRVATADVDGDGFTDVVAAPGPGGGPVVNVFSGKDGSLLAGFFALDPGYRGGVTVAAADLDADGKAEVVVGAGVGGGPMVAVFRGGDLALVQTFFAFDPAFRGGVNVAAGSFAGVGPAIVAGAGAGGGSAVALFRYDTGEEVLSLFAFDEAYRDGASVAAGDLTGDGFAELAVAPAAGSPRVRVLDPLAEAELASLFAGDPQAAFGTRLAIRGGRLLVAGGPGSRSTITAYSGLGTDLQILFDDPDRAYGVFVG